MVGVCIAVWNIDKSMAVQWFLEVTTNDLRLACGHDAQTFCNLAFPAFAEHLAPLISTMIESNSTDIANEGAMEATARWLFFDNLRELAARCVSGTEPQRKGVARIVAHFVAHEDYSEKCKPLMVRLGDDESEDVRKEVGRALRNSRLLNLPGCDAFLTSLAGTRVFRDNSGTLLFAFDQYVGSLVPFSSLVFLTVTSAIDALSQPNDKTRSSAPMTDRHVVTVLLRLYEQAGNMDADIRNRCLDLFDDLLKKRIATSRDLIEAGDR